MFCERCGTKLPDDALFCDECGARQGQTKTANEQQPQQQPLQQFQQQQPQQQFQQIQQTVAAPVLEERPLVQPQKKKRWPIVLAVVIAAALVLGVAGVLAYNFAIAPSDEENEDQVVAVDGAADAGEPAIIGIMEMTGESLRSLKPLSGANFEFEMSAEGQDVSFNGFFELGDDLESSVAYVSIFAMGESIEAAFNNGMFFYDDGISVNSVEFSALNAVLGFDLNGLVKNGSLDTEAVTELIGEAYGTTGIGSLKLSEAVWKEFDEAWNKYLQDNTDALDEAFTVKSQTDERVEYQIHVEKFYELLSDCLDHLAYRGSAAAAEMSEELLGLMESADVKAAVREISDITVILELDDGNLESMKLEISDSSSDLSFSLRTDKQYLSSIGLSVSGDADISLSLELKNHNSPRINTSKLNSLAERAEPVDMGGAEVYDEPYADSNESYVAADGDGYLFPSDTQYITEAYLRALTRDEVALIRNEIYARHGYIFKTEKYQQYFSAKSWYVKNPNYDGTSLSAIEAANVKTITDYEASMGWR